MEVKKAVFTCWDDLLTSLFFGIALGRPNPVSANMRRPTIPARSAPRTGIANRSSSPSPLIPGKAFNSLEHNVKGSCLQTIAAGTWMTFTWHSRSKALLCLNQEDVSQVPPLTTAHPGDSPSPAECAEERLTASAWDCSHTVCFLDTICLLSVPACPACSCLFVTPPPPLCAAFTS